MLKSLIRLRTCCNLVHNFALFSRNMELESMEKAAIRCVDDNDIMQLTFNYGCEGIRERKFYFNRSKEEELSKLFERVNNAILSKLKKKQGKKMKENDEGDACAISPENIEVSLSYNGHLVDGTTSNSFAWRNGAVLQVGDRSYEVVINPPSVLSLKLPKNIMAGFPVYPKVELEFASKIDSEFTWYKTLNENEKLQMKMSKLCSDDIVKSVSGWWTKAGSGYFLITLPSDIGRKLKIVCMPKLEGKCGFSAELESPGSIEAGPGTCPFEDRHLYTKHFTGSGSIRTLSYNILADLYADSNFSRTVLFPYCPAYALTIDYRKQLLLKEILGYNADLICLQEVDSKIYKYDLAPFLEMSDLNGVFQEKGGQVVEGLACFYRSTKFRYLISNNIILSESIQMEPMFADIFIKVCGNAKLSERLLQRTTALQTVLLECLDKPGHKILVGNTHLYFHPDAAHIRLLQSAMVIRYMEYLKKMYSEQYPESSIAVLLCGDFNSCPEFGVYQLMTTGYVSQDADDWKSSGIRKKQWRKFKSKRHLKASDEAVVGLSVSHNLLMASACGCPLYTNYTSEFNGCLDYIFYQNDKLTVTECVPLPSHEEVTQHTALPNIVFPSDHLALVATLKWT